MKQFDRSRNAILILLLLTIPIQARTHNDVKHKEKSPELPAVIWRDPGDISSLNLIYGTGGSKHAPDPNGTYTFEKEVLQGTSPKFDVQDEHGVKWRVKLGQEVQAETAATRLLWAAGYFVDEDYYLPQIKVEGLPGSKVCHGSRNRFSRPTGTRGQRHQEDRQMGLV